ncbi:MAG: GAF domain-containing protein [Anaerolineae bacterium]|nr:GAF domain-containing protein [Anaerolineae bacterium]
MTTSVVISLIALLSYSGLLILILHQGLGKSHPRRLYFLYLLDMLLMQVSYLMLSLTNNSQAALFWYALHISLSTVQAIIYFIFVRTFLRLSPLHKGVQVIIFIWLAVVILSAALYPDFYFMDIYHYEATALFVPEITFWGTVLLLPTVLLWSLTVFYLGKNYRDARSPLQRVRIQYLLLSILIVWGGLLANVWPTFRPYPIDVAANIVGAFLIAYAILRYQLLDISIVIRKSLSYVVSVIFFGTGYFATILVSTRFFQHLTVLQIFLLSLAMAILSVILSRPVVNRVHLLIDQTFFHEEYSSTLMLQRLSRTVTSVLDLEELIGMILDDLTRTLHIRWAVFFLEQEGTLSLFVHKGLDSVPDMDLCHDDPIVSWLTTHKTIMAMDTLDDILAQDILQRPQFDELKRLNARMFIPLVARDRMVGVLGVGAKLSSWRYTQDDEVILGTLANQVAIAVDNARLYATIQHELTERKKLIAELEAKNTELERFTYTVSHDLKSPLITVGGFIGFLQKDLLDGDITQAQEDMARITAALAKMQQLLDELLELSRIGRRMNPPETAPFEAIAREALELVHGRITAGNVTVEIMPDLPTVYGDRARLVEVVQNLVDNACKYMGNTSHPYVKIGARQTEAETVFYVRDNGIGIDPQYHEKVFGLFDKLDPASEGAGVGLAIAKRIVEVHGGKIWVESEGRGQGSTFCFTLSNLIPHKAVQRK